tara:strand:- start:532 stop:1074 length:543 start_codon:yes stop_codon:yes gene_type:complete
MFTPPHWNHKNIKFPKEEIDLVISKLKIIPVRGLLSKNHSSWFPNSIKPESIWNKKYSKILEDILSNMGIEQHGTYNYTFWAQLYLDGGTHKVHNHIPDFEISFVHFLKVPDKPLFRFTNTVGDFYYPKQKTGDIVCFPSWVWHEVIANDTDTERLVVAGNVHITEMFEAVKGDYDASYR